MVIREIDPADQPLFDVIARVAGARQRRVAHARQIADPAGVDKAAPEIIAVLTHGPQMVDEAVVEIEPFLFDHSIPRAGGGQVGRCFKLQIHAVIGH